MCDIFSGAAGVLPRERYIRARGELRHVGGGMHRKGPDSFLDYLLEVRHWFPLQKIPSCLWLSQCGEKQKQETALALLTTSE